MRRTLDWWSLCQVAVRRSADQRLISIAGVAAQVKPTRGAGPGFLVCGLDEDVVDLRWQLRTPAEMVLLARLVEAGAVTIDEPDTSPLRQEPRT